MKKILAKKKIWGLVGANLVVYILVGFFFFLLHKPVNAPTSLLAPHITMGQLELKVNNLTSMEQFYTKLIGMQVLSQSSSVVLGFNKESVLTLDNTPSLRVPSSSDPGIDQIALVFSSRAGLAHALQRILSQNPSLYQGGTDRGAVGEAFYVIDPQGNSLELYYDTDPSTWPRSSLGNVESDALPIDINKYIQTYAGQTGDSTVRLGHLQIQIGDITEGKQFYVGTIGFYAIPQLLGDGSSVFMSDGYYHHDLVINQIQGYDGDRINNYLGLKGFSFFVPDMSYVNALVARLKKANILYSLQKETVVFKDPWGIEITVEALPHPWWDIMFFPTSA